MALAGLAFGDEALGIGGVMSDGLRGKANLDFAGLEEASAFEIEADFQAVGVKTTGPIEAFGALEVVPFHAHAVLIEAAMEGAPFAIDAGPGGGFVGLADGRHLELILRLDLNIKAKAGDFSVACVGERAGA